MPDEFVFHRGLLCPCLSYFQVNSTMVGSTGSDEVTSILSSFRGLPITLMIARASPTPTKPTQRRRAILKLQSRVCGMLCSYVYLIKEIWCMCMTLEHCECIYLYLQNQKEKVTLGTRLHTFIHLCTFLTSQTGCTCQSLIHKC